MLSELLAQATNGSPLIPIAPITGNEAIDGMIHASPALLVFVVIQVVVAGAKKAEWVVDKYIPLIAVTLGGFLYPALATGWNVKTVLIGILAGAGSSSIHEVVAQFRAPKPPEPPAPPAPPAPTTP